MAVAILYPGSMGSSLAWAIHQRSPSIQLLTCVQGRSDATKKRAEASGLSPVGMEEIVATSRVIVSILPPSESTKLAQEVIQLWSFVSSPSNGESKAGKDSNPPIYIDANAVSPSTANTLASLFLPSGIPFLDGSVIGGPSRQGYDPRIYLSASSADEGALEQVIDLLGEGKGLNLIPMRGAGVGAASALKMSYAGLTKGSTGLATAMVLSASRHSPRTAQALIEELKYSQPGILNRATGQLESMLPKAYRWVGEMEEIAEYISNPTGLTKSDSTTTTLTSGDHLATLTGSGLQTPGLTTGVLAPGETEQTKSEMADIYRGIARAFEGIARDLEKGGEGEVRLLKDFIAKGREASE